MSIAAQLNVKTPIDHTDLYECAAWSRVHKSDVGRFACLADAVFAGCKAGSWRLEARGVQLCCVSNATLKVLRAFFQAQMVENLKRAGEYAAGMHTWKSDHSTTLGQIGGMTAHCAGEAARWGRALEGLEAYAMERLRRAKAKLSEMRKNRATVGA